jgi:hypothetical protein
MEFSRIVVKRVGNNEGFIFSVHGDGATALFASVLAAFTTSVEIVTSCKGLESAPTTPTNTNTAENGKTSPFLHKAGSLKRPTMSSWMSLSYGIVATGAIGARSRIFPAIASPELERVKWMNSLYSVFGAPIITTKQTVDQFPNLHCLFVRRLGRVRDKKANMVEDIYEIFHSDTREEREHKELRKDAVGNCMAKLERGEASIADTRRDLDVLVHPNRGEWVDAQLKAAVAHLTQDGCIDV